jgi:hypothetical protein
MKYNTTCLVLLLSLSALKLQAASYPVVDLSANKPEVVALLRANYVDYSKAADQRNNLQSMIAHSRGGLSVASIPATDERMFSTLLPNNVIYWRAGSFTPATSWDEMTAQACGAQPTGLVLDLRSNTTPDDFAGAMRIASFLSQGQTGLVFHEAGYTAVAASQPSLQSAPTVIVLTDKQTRGAAEILAAALQARGALVMGQATSGNAAIFHEIPLNSGHVLRYASSHVYLSSGVDLWNHPVMPDVTTPVRSRDEAQALALIDRQQVGAVITEDANRHRMCEAALVRGQDPEQDTFIAAHEAAAPAPQAPVTRDLALVEALDSLKAIRVVQGEESSPLARVAASSATSAPSMIALSTVGR